MTEELKNNGDAIYGCLGGILFLILIEANDQNSIL